MSDVTPTSTVEGLPPGDIRLPDGSYQVVYNVDVIYTNMSAASDFRILRTGTNGHVEKALLQVAKHLERGLYKIVSLNASKHAMHVIISTDKPCNELTYKQGFPWDPKDD
ncbi:hypothetical protein V2A60_002510 [Cordyceps javanica]|uniref:Uncharacterized protein n=1 Tax=Cordyceps javanica TaxID=43265 RepID=A0A545UN04_9HYPO|nr:hypothetical protein IF1G_10573 [Cordyceps javanica]TQW02464.1 hypothetical protein IF2G_10064 [Cordyceps javanica]